MLQRLLLHRALIASAALAVLAPSSPWLAGARADAAQVTVVSPGGDQRPLALEALAGGEDVVERSYVLRSGSGESTKIVSGFSLGKILEAAGADPFGFSYLEVQRPGGGSVLLSRHQALDPGAFPEGPPVVYATATGTGFVRPSTGPGDLNASDCFEAPQGLQIVLRKGVQLRVRAKATTYRADPGEKVGFSAVVEGAGSGEAVTFSWTFDDGSSRLANAGDSVSHSFAKPGSYDVVVGATTPGNETGASDVVTVQVGEPAGGGPDRKGGGTNKDRNAPDHGAATGPATGTSGTEGPASIPPPPAESFPPAEPAPEPVPVPESAPEPLPVPEPEGEPVSGLLLEEGGAAAPEPESELEAEPAAARTGTLSEKGGGGGSLPGAAVGLLITGALLGAGCLVEARNLLR